jgi:ABC-type molybdate transport system substrate-binding protein
MAGPCVERAAVATGAAASQPNVDPPWHPPPQGVLNFTVPGIENAPDLHGDPEAPDLALFMGGNQFMVMPDLLAAFQKRHPEIRRIFYETLPPGVLAEQLQEGGAIVVGNLQLTIHADIFASGAGRMEKERAAGLVQTPVTYARNDLTILVPSGNPRGIRTLADLGRPDLRLSLPNPQTEGIGQQIGRALEQAGGPALRSRVLDEKVHDGSTVLTRIHHRETPLALLHGQADAGVVWRTEALFQRSLGHRLEAVEIPSAQNAVGVYQAAMVSGAPHEPAARAFLEFLVSLEGEAIFARYGFSPPSSR